MPRTPLALLFVALIKRYFSDKVGGKAAALAYYFLFSFFPFLVFISMLLGFLEIPVKTITSQLNGLLPGDIIDIISLYIEYVTKERSSNLLVFGLIFTIYFPMRAVDFLMKSVNHAYRVTATRSFLPHQATVFLFTLFLIFSIFISLALMTIGTHQLTFLSVFFEISADFIAAWNYLRFLILSGILFTTLALLYHIAPNRRASIRSVLPGALLSLLSWLIISIGFAFYVENIAEYSLVYGSIGAIIVLLMWLYFSAVTLIMGAEFNHILLTAGNDLALDSTEC